jgi:PPP family 3-phenylpropionic acid transporter
MQMHPASTAAPPHYAIRLSIFFAGYFLFGGISVPFFPVWLQARGLSEVEIANCIAIPALVRVLLTPLAGMFADRAPNRRFAACVFTLPAAIIFAFAWPATGYWALLGITGAATILWAFALPVVEALALTGVRRFGLDYGRVRLSGSIAFILANLGSGALLSIFHPEAIFWLILAAFVSSTVVAFLLPVTPPNVRALDEATRPERKPARAVLGHPAFLTLIVVGALIQSSHAVLYSFGSIHWRSLGFSGVDIGAFWAIGIGFEITIFALSRRAVGFFGPFGLLVLGACAAILRWIVLAQDPGFAATLAVQTLHGVTFGAVYLGNQHAIARAVPEELTASAQGLFAMISGVLMAGTVALAGPLYHGLGAHAYLVMIALPALALVILAAYRFVNGATG